MNNKYKYIKSPPKFPGKTYQNNYCYEHHYIFWKHNNQVPKNGECIHHIDGDPENNDINNLELLSNEDHGLIHGNDQKPILANWVYLECPICKKRFFRLRRQTHLVKKKHRATFCSRKCSGKYKTYLETNITNNVIAEFKYHSPNSQKL
jgi:hypothetical protein